MTSPQPAGVGARIAAGLLDALLLGVLFGLFSAAFGESDTSGGSFSFQLSGLPFLVYLVLALGYFFVLESTGGRTLGKRALGLRVVRTDGSPPSGGSVAVRTLLRFVDGLPILYLVGIVCILATGKRRQRVGDLAADTTVVKG